MSTLTIRPRRNYLVEWTGNGYADDDDVSPDDFNTYNMLISGTSKRNIYYLGLPDAFGVISSVEVHIRMRAYDDRTPKNTAGTCIRTHGSSYNGDANSISAAWTDYSTTYNTNPYTGQAWTWQELVDLQAGYWGTINPSNGYPIYCTQVYVIITYTSANYNTVTLRPTGAGDLTQLQHSAGANYECVDEETSDEDSTYVYDNTGVLSTDLYQLSNAAVGKVIYVVVKMVARCSTPGTPYGAVKMKTGGTVFGTPEIALPGTFTTYSEQWGYNPATGAEWTQSDIDSLQAGVALRFANAGPVCTQVYVVVGSYTPSNKPRAQIIGLW